MEFSKELYSLSQAPTFLLIDMENVIDSIRACVTEVCEITLIISSCYITILATLYNVFRYH